MKNKIFATLLALTLALSLTACGSKSDDSAKADTTDDAQTEQPAEPQETVTLNVAASPTRRDPEAVRTHSGRAGHRPADPRVQRLCGAQYRRGGR